MRTIKAATAAFFLVATLTSITFTAKESHAQENWICRYDDQGGPAQIADDFLAVFPFDCYAKVDFIGGIAFIDLLVTVNAGVNDDGVVGNRRPPDDAQFNGSMKDRRCSLEASQVITVNAVFDCQDEDGQGGRAITTTEVVGAARFLNTGQLPEIEVTDVKIIPFTTTLEQFLENKSKKSNIRKKIEIKDIKIRNIRNISRKNLQKLLPKLNLKRHL